MWLDRLLESRTRSALELAARFTEQRHKVLAENVANVDTPDYRTRRLDATAFQSALQSAIGESRRAGNERLELRSAQVSTGANGELRTTPVVEPASNVLHHDGTNARLESLMTDAQQNALSHSLSMSLLRGKFDSLLTAIRGRSGR